MKKSIAAKAGSCGATIGQAIIPVPVVGSSGGTMVGSFIAQATISSPKELVERPYTEMLLCTNARRSFASFIINSYNCQMYFEDWIKKLAASHKVYKKLKDIYSKL